MRRWTTKEARLALEWARSTEECRAPLEELSEQVGRLEHQHQRVFLGARAVTLAGSDDQDLSLAYWQAGAVKGVDKDLSFQHHVHLVLGVLVELVGAHKAAQIGTVIIYLAQYAVGERLGKKLGHLGDIGFALRHVPLLLEHGTAWVWQQIEDDTQPRLSKTRAD